MAGIGNVMPSVAKLGNGGHGVLDLIFRDCALIMSDTTILYADKLSGTLGSIASSIEIPFPIVGFSFQTPEQLNILHYDYSEYPLYSRMSVVNSMVKGMGHVKVTGLRPITRGNSIAINYLLNQFVLVKLIESYCDAGGLWSLNTMWGTYNDLVLEDLDGINPDNAGAGVGFAFTFKKVNFGAIDKQKGIVNKLISKLSS